MTGCTTCPFPEGLLPYSPSTPANAVLLSAFAVLIPASLFLGYRFPALGFTLNFVAAQCLEVLSFAGRLLLVEDGRSEAFFALYLLGSVLGETAFASAVFAVLSHVLCVYGASARRGTRVAVGFGGLLAVIVVLEIVGIASALFGIGGFVSTRVLVAGLALQAVALALFVAIHAWAASGLRSSAQPDAQHAPVHQSRKFKRLLIILHLSVALLLATTIYRIVEITPSLSAAAAANEAASTTLHGALPLILALLLTAAHPGLAFGRAWSKTTPRYVSPKPAPSASADNPYRAPEARYSIRRVAPARLSNISAASSTPYELYPSPVTSSPAHSPRKSSHTSPMHSPWKSSYSPATSPRKSSHTVSPMHSPWKSSYSPANSPRKSSHTASPAHSPRKIPETTLVDDDALW